MWDFHQSSIFGSSMLLVHLYSSSDKQDVQNKIEHKQLPLSISLLLFCLQFRLDGETFFFRGHFVQNHKSTTMDLSMKQKVLAGAEVSGYHQFQQNKIVVDNIFIFPQQRVGKGRLLTSSDPLFGRIFRYLTTVFYWNLGVETGSLSDVQPGIGL